jgi:hypothetical protein
MFFALDDARAGDEEKIAGTDVDVADLEGSAQFKTFSSPGTPRSQRKALENLSSLVFLCDLGD